MELLESNDFKRELVKKSEKHREELQNEVRLVSEKTEKIITNALVIGGALAVTYFLLNQFSGGKSKPKQKVRKIKLVKEHDDDVVEVAEAPSSPGVLSQIGTTLASQASVILLDLAKEKLAEYLASRHQPKEEKE
ncbi:hypothetical protein [Pseudochryseolinea flava]|uniref:Uncharacterized protein n=1 Tax=Pseudochryseolinea flava TaxID=2059302 RepID=A0A364YCE2_9BACT|nr:hypothetical protein [Pseudochryseolinea flava]RAW03378.1 hypothetical protein DQQ10_04640 [Pseudochryseolinea flava]